MTVTTSTGSKAATGRRTTRATPRRATRPTYRTPQERRAEGKSLRKSVPLESHGSFTRPTDSPDPIALLDEQSQTRVPELVPIRYGRMMVTPFTFYRGAARVMAADLSTMPRTELTAQLCGDAHLSNFGVFGSPERRLVFDINDFDETLPGPFEWDVKRLVASLAVAARESGFTRKQRRSIVAAAGARYRSAMAEFAEMREIDLWYQHLDVDDMMDRLRRVLDARRQKKLGKVFDKARTRDSVQAMAKMTGTDNGRVRILADPPLIVPLRDLLPAGEDEDFAERFHTLVRAYRRTLQNDRRTLLERYHFVDMARKVVGVGSVGTRCWIVLLTGRDAQDPLFLQVKEATDSVLAEFLTKSEYANQGQRVVAGQRLMQQSSDVFLGWQRTTGIDGVQRDFYIRQLRDWKGSITVEALLPEGMQLYGEVCAWSLARAHACSGDRMAIAGYLGSSDTFDKAMVEFAESYADVNERDHQRLVDAVAAGSVTAQSGL